MDNNILSEIRKDIAFLLSFVPAKHPDEVDAGLAPMFYVTGSYNGDVDLAARVSEIVERYGVEDYYNEEDEEDFIDEN